LGIYEDPVRFCTKLSSLRSRLKNSSQGFTSGGSEIAHGGVERLLAEAILDFHFSRRMTATIHALHKFGHEREDFEFHIDGCIGPLGSCWFEMWLLFGACGFGPR
jgi:hypothetical protein